MKDLRIGYKVAFSFGLIFLILLGLSISMAHNYRLTKRKVDEVIRIKGTMTNIYTFLEHLIDAETGQRGYMITGNEDYLEPYHRATHHMDSHFRELSDQISKTHDQLRYMEELNQLVREKKADMESTINILQEKGMEEAHRTVQHGRGKEVMDDIRVSIGHILRIEEKQLQDKYNEMESLYLQTRRTILWAGSIALLFVVLITIYFTRTIARPIERAANKAEMIASGDLSEPIGKLNRRDEVGMLVNSLSTMSGILLNQLTEIRNGIDVLSSSSSEIMSGVAQLAASASQTATAIGETTTTIEEVKQTAEVSNSKAQEVSKDSRKNARISQEGNKAIQETAESMQIISQKMEMIANVVLGLNEQSHTIGEITATVNDLAEQSNILAVNAAIEAAKAGEQGRGFSVVAQEIKNLAMRSKEATSQVRSILNETQKSISKVVMATEDGGRTVETGSELIKASKEAIDLLSRSVNLAAQASMQIASSSQQQLVGMDQVVIAMENIRDSSSQIAVTTQQTNVSVNDLHQVGERLQELINFYKVN